MANILGDLWESGEPDWSAVFAFPSVKLHLYGKATARAGRKMGHLTAIAATSEEARAVVVRARSGLRAGNRRDRCYKEMFTLRYLRAFWPVPSRARSD